MERKLLTDEEKKESRKNAQKKWRLKNKEYIKKYREDNKEHISSQRKVYYKDNKDKLLAYTRDYRVKNEQKTKKSVERYRNSLKLHGLHIVYCLPNNNNPYVGVTNQPRTRMLEHNSKGNDTSDWFVLRVCESRRDALDIEKDYHSLGFAGNIRNIKR
jgi:hypothetical protein